MIKRPGKSPYNRRFRRKPQHTVPEPARLAAHRQPTEPQLAATHTLRRKLRALVNGLIRKLLSLGKAALLKRGGLKAGRLRFAVCAGSGVVVTVVLLLVLLAPGGAAAPASGSSSASATASPTPIPTTAPDIIPIATTEPEFAITPTPEPVETPKPTHRPTATPKPTHRPTATPKPTHRPTATPSPTHRPTATSTPPASSGNTDMASLVAFYAVTADTYYNKVGYSTNHYNYTDEELIVLARIMQIEAGSRTGMIAVGNVIMNRVLCGRFGSTITAVVTAKNQFAYNPSVTPRQGAIDAAHAVLDDEEWVVPQNTYFFKGSGTEGVAWGGHAYCTTIAGNYFYTANYTTRYNGTSIPPALYKRTYQYPQYGCKPEERVKRVQFMLDALGYDIERADGYFGKGTKDAVIAFQKDHGLGADGVAGPATVEALIREYGVENYCDKYL